MKRYFLTLLIICIGSAIISSCVTAQKPSVGVPTIRVLEPLDKPAFKSVKVIGITEMVKGEDGKKEVDLAELKPGFESVLNQVPFFSGGEWPDLNINVKVLSCNSGIGGCWALLIPSILLWPGYMLVGGPTYCIWSELIVVFEATAGEFKREYKYNLKDYGAGGLYYRPDPFDGASMYMGHAVWAFAQKISEDYSDFLKNEIDSNPSIYSKSLNPDLKKWYYGNSSDKMIPTQATPNTGEIQDLQKEYTYLLIPFFQENDRKKIKASENLTEWSGNRLLDKPDDEWALETIKQFEIRVKDQKQSEEVRNAAQKGLEKS